MGGSNHGGQRDEATRTISWLYEKDALLDERARDPVQERIRPRTTNLDTKQQQTSFVITSIQTFVSNLPFVVKVRKR